MPYLSFRNCICEKILSAEMCRKRFPETSCTPQNRQGNGQPREVLSETTGCMYDFPNNFSDQLYGRSQNASKLGHTSSFISTTRVPWTILLGALPSIISSAAVSPSPTTT